MGITEPNEERGSLPRVDHADLLRALTVERFTVWKPPASASELTTPVGHSRSQPSRVNTSDATNVRGRVDDDKKNNKPGRLP
ncbi:MAG: hypothetical protein ABI934_10480 [Actinomycetota bacterium]